MSSSVDHWKSRTVLLIATAIVAVLMFVPYGYFAIYPFSLFGTFIHEAGHALATVVTGGEVGEMIVNWDTSGHVMRRGGAGLVVAPAGYLGSIIAGALLLLAGKRRKWARPTLLVVGVSTLVITGLFAGTGDTLIPVVGFGMGVALIGFGRARAERGDDASHLNALGGGALLVSLAFLWYTGGLLTWAIGLMVGAGLLFIAAYGNRFLQHLTVLFLGVQLSLDGLNSVQVLWNVTADGHQHSDAATMADLTGLPASFWAISWGVMGLAIIGGAFWLFWRQDENQNEQKTA